MKGQYKQDDDDNVPLLDDGPPSYDSATGPSGSSGSGAPSGSNGLATSSAVLGSFATAAAESSIERRPLDTTYPYTSPPGAVPLTREVRPDVEEILVHKAKSIGGGESWIETSDKRLNDPELLYDFIRIQALTPPTVKIRCYGSHTERTDRHETVYVNGVREDRRTGDTRTVVDFDFFITIPIPIGANVHLFPLPPSVPGLRGSHDPSFGGYGPTSGRGLSWSEWRRECAYYLYRSTKGIPIWAKRDESYNGFPLIKPYESGLHAQEQEESGGGPTLREWCAAYAASSGPTKELIMRKQIWGWDVEGVVRAVRECIQTTGYSGASVSLQVGDDRVVVRTDGWYARIMMSRFVRVLLWVLMVMPVLWVLRRVGVIRGATWDVGRATYALKYYPPLPSTHPTESLAQASNRLQGLYKLHPEIPKGTKLGLGPKGVHYLVGKKEGTWFREWEERIKMGVRMRYQGGEIVGGGEGEGRGGGLDGYDE